MEEYLRFIYPGIDAHVKGGAGPKPWPNALKIRDFKLEAYCPNNIPPVVKNRPIQGIRWMPEHLELKSRRYFAPNHQLEWYLHYDVVPNAQLCKFDHHPRALGTDTLSLNVARPRFPDIHNTHVNQPQNATPTGSSTHHPVIVTPFPGSTMAQTSGFDPSISSNMQSFEPAQFVERNNISELRPGEGVASGEDTAGTSKPRIQIPKAMHHYTKGDVVCIEDQADGAHGYRPMHHPPHCSCVLGMWTWNGTVNSIP